MSANDGEQSTRVAVPPPPPPNRLAMNVMDANLLLLQRQERELSVTLRGRAARDYGRELSDGGEGSEVASPWRFVALSELIVPQPPAVDESAQADHSVEICRSCRRWIAATPQVPYRHICLCVTCRHSPSARICCSVCSAGRRSSSTAPP